MNELREAIFHLSDCVSSRPDVLDTALRALKTMKWIEEPHKDNIEEWKYWRGVILQHFKEAL